MLFGLFNTPASFQGYINKIFIEKLDIFIIIYLDIIFIYIKEPSQSHMEVICWVLNQLWKYSFFPSLKKGQFY